jgi:DNA-binding response OmpR family regulator
MAGERILIVEDDPHTVELVRLYLDRDGHRVLTAADGIEGLRQARESQPDLVVLDVMLPGIDGLEVCRQLRAHSTVPIVMLTARVEEEDRLTGLDLGADDYVTKPFSPRELAARVRAVLRRTARDRATYGQEELVYRQVRLNLQERSVCVGDIPVRLTPTEFRLLALMVREPGRVFTRDLIIERAFGYDFEGFDRTVDAHVSSLRRKLESTPDRARYIHTVYGVGYKFGDD